MIKLIIGKKGSGKTKTLIEMVNSAALSSKGNVVCIEKGAKLTFDLNHEVRLINIDDSGIYGYPAFYGFLAGLLAGNYDITDIFVDSIYYIAGEENVEFEKFLKKLSTIVDDSKINVVLTVSNDAADLSNEILKYTA